MTDSVPYSLLSLDDLPGVTAFLAAQGWLGNGEQVVGMERAGEGNMNLVLRVVTSARSVILKQSRPWVQKYPSIEAPVERAHVEQAFYATIAAEEPVAAGMPALLAAAPDEYALLFEDLGPASDLTGLYGDAELSDADAAWLGQWLGALHRANFEPQNRLANRAMRALNHVHIFQLPLSESRPELDPDLEPVARRLLADAAYCRRVEALGRAYLSDGPVLLHGDYYPGSWVRAGGDLRVIDPEFGFFGPPEFDLGVAWAHLLIAGVAGPERLLAAYGDADIDRSLLNGFAGAEIMRRILGVAKLPMERTPEQLARLLDVSAELVLTG